MFSCNKGTIAFDSNGSRISNSILLQQHYLTGKTFKTYITGIIVLKYLEDEDIEMKSVADIVIYHNESIFMYKENITSQSLWPGELYINLVMLSASDQFTSS